MALFYTPFACLTHGLLGTPLAVGFSPSVDITVGAEVG